MTMKIQLAFFMPGFSSPLGVILSSAAIYLLVIGGSL